MFETLKYIAEWFINLPEKITEFFDYIYLKIQINLWIGFKDAFEWFTGVFFSITDWNARGEAIQTAYAALPHGAIWFAQQLNVSACLGIIVGAYGIKFLIKLIPFVG